MSREVRVGLMFALSLIILGAALSYLGSFQEMLEYKIQFQKVSGLTADAPVQFNGVRIGRVKKIKLSESDDLNAPVSITVTIVVDRTAERHIRQSTRADIKSIGILGDKAILLTTNSYEVELLEEGDFIMPSTKSLDVEKLLAQGTDMVTDITEVTENLKRILNQLANEEGVLQELIGNKELAQKFTKSMSRTLENLEKDRNLLNLVLADEAYAKKMAAQSQQILGDVSSMTAKLKDADGLVPTLMTDVAYREKVQAQLDLLLETSNTYAKTLSEGRGLFYKMTQDEAYGTRVSENLEKATYHLASILEKIDEGDGSASLLLNDPSLYEGLYEVVYGVKHSGVTSWLVQRKQKKGAKILKKESKEDVQ